MDGKKVTLKQFNDMIPEHEELIYVDYRDSLNGHEELIQKCISNGNFDPLYEEIDEWYRDMQWDNEKRISDDVFERIEDEFDMTEDEIEEFKEKYEDWIRDMIYDKCGNSALPQLLSNTSKMIAHYDTGYYVEADSWSWQDYRIRYERICIKKHLGIMDIQGYDEELDMMIRQASYGGQLLIYFELEDVEDLMSKMETAKSIVFDDFMIGIVNHGNGSGDVMESAIKKEITLSFDTDNFWLEKSIKYNWTYSIAGMMEYWAQSTIVKLSDEDIDQEIDKSPTAELQKREAEYNKTFAEGGCTFGDMDIKRHRNTPYINSFPCGNRCTKCGTFWID